MQQNVVATQLLEALFSPALVKRKNSPPAGGEAAKKQKGSPRPVVLGGELINSLKRPSAPIAKRAVREMLELDSDLDDEDVSLEEDPLCCAILREDKKEVSWFLRRWAKSASRQRSAPRASLPSTMHAGTFRPSSLCCWSMVQARTRRVVRHLYALHKMTT